MQRLPVFKDSSGTWGVVLLLTGMMPACGQAAVLSGVVDGIMLDWWRDDADHLSLVKAIRSRVGDKALIPANANDVPTPDHLHHWYPFWERCLGAALAPGVARPDGAMTREFAKGTAAYNPMGNQPVTKLQ